MIRRKKYLDILFDLILLVQLTGVDSQGEPCNDDATVGPEHPETFNTDFDNDKGFGYVVYGDLYESTCCGTIKKWVFSNGDTGYIELQVWRPSDKKNKKFKLVGLNKYNVGKKDRKVGYVSYEVPDKDRILVEENDVIGWYAPGDSLIQYTDSTTYTGIWKLQHDNKVKIGDDVDFSTGAKQSSRTYGIQTTLAKNSPPVFDLLLKTSIRMNAEVGTVVYTVQWSDDDAADVKGLRVEMTTPNEFFAFNPKTGVLSVSSKIVVPEGGKTVTFEFKVEDHCGAEGTGSLAVSIEYVSIRPTLPPRTDSPTDTTKEIKRTPTTQPAKTLRTTKAAATTETKIKKIKPTNVIKTLTTTSSFVTSPVQGATGGITSPANVSMAAMKTGSKIGAGGIAGIAVGIVVLIVISVVAVVYIVSKKARVRPADKDAEMADNTSNGKANDTSNEKQPSPDEKAPNTKPDMNGKQ